MRSDVILLTGALIGTSLCANAPTRETGLHSCRRSDPVCYPRSITAAMLTGASSALQVQQQSSCCGRCWHWTSLLPPYINWDYCFLLISPPLLQVWQHPKLLLQVLALDKLVAAMSQLMSGLGLIPLLCCRCRSTWSCCGRCWSGTIWRQAPVK